MASAQWVHAVLASESAAFRDALILKLQDLTREDVRWIYPSEAREVLGLSEAETNKLLAKGLLRNPAWQVKDVYTTKELQDLGLSVRDIERQQKFNGCLYQVEPGHFKVFDHLAPSEFYSNLLNSRLMMLEKADDEFKQGQVLAF